MNTSPSVSSAMPAMESTRSDSISTSKSIGPITWDDATWILTSSFIIFTMQSGFGLLEAGCVSRRNEVNIMMKNAVDVVFGGLSYWAFGFGFSFGNDYGSNAFCGIGYFFVDSTEDQMGLLFSTYVFQLSFATTATTIVSGAMAERTKLDAYILFSFFNTLVYCFPAHWEWATNGFLRELGCVDIAGSGAVHLVGGVSALVAAALLRPRIGRFDSPDSTTVNPLPMGNPANALVGMFMLWWGWLAFNCGSTFGISGGKWKLAAKAAVTTLNSSMGGGFVGIVLSFILKKRKYDVGYLINTILGALVSITAGCAIIRPWEAVIIGLIGGLISIGGEKLITVVKVDDPVGAISVHGFCGLWGMLSVGLFAQKDPVEDTTMGRSGLFHGGGFYLLGVQLLTCVCIIAWSGLVSLIVLKVIDMTIGIRLSPEDEKAGADYSEHGVGEGGELERYGTPESSNRGMLSRPLSARSQHSNHSNAQVDHSEDSDSNLVFKTKCSSARLRWDKVVPIAVTEDRRGSNTSKKNIPNGTNKHNVHHHQVSGPRRGSLMLGGHTHINLAGI